MSHRNIGLLNSHSAQTWGRALSVCLLASMTSMLACAQSLSEWSGSIEYAVSPGEMERSTWDYLPQTITYQTDGTHWRIHERGTSFERIWLGQHGATSFHVLFHFLGHAVELLESCPTMTHSDSFDFKGIPAPCPWQSGTLTVLEEEMTVTDGPARYTMVQTQQQAVVKRNWPKGHFDLPEGYEPMDKMSLAALLARLDNRSRE